MTLWSDLFPTKQLLSRIFYEWRSTGPAPGGGPRINNPYDIIAPAGAIFGRVHMVGGGGRAGSQTTPGAGAAFARAKFACTPGEAFVLIVGKAQPWVSEAAGVQDSVLTRVTGSVVLCKAAGAVTTSPGAAANCVGDVKRSGSAGTPWPDNNLGGLPIGGASAGDDADPFPLGFGGPGAITAARGQDMRAAYPGGGGVSFSIMQDRPSSAGVISSGIGAGPGRACVEFFNMDPDA